MKQGVGLGRGKAPAFSGVLPGVTICRIPAAGTYTTGTGYGLYGSTSYVRAIVLTVDQPYDPTTGIHWRTNPTGTGWFFNAVASSGLVRLRHFDTTATARPSNTALPLEWPSLSFVVWTYDGTNQRAYVNGVLQYTAAIANIQPADSGTSTMNVISSSESVWFAHLLGSDAAPAFLDDAGVFAWTQAAARSMRMRTAITPWSGCTMWWNAEDSGARNWTDRIGGVIATMDSPTTLPVKKSLTTGSVPRL